MESIFKTECFDAIFDKIGIDILKWQCLENTSFVELWHSDCRVREFLCHIKTNGLAVMEQQTDIPSASPTDEMVASK